MELNVDRPALAGQNIDPDTFQRVWNRVMPEQTALPDTAVPAEPTVPPAQQPETPSDTPVLPPVPDCPALSPVPDCPQETPCPTCPECPDCPPQTECPSCPETPEQPSPPALCLGEASLEDSGQLEILMTLARSGTLAGQALVRRASGSCARALSALTCDHRLAFRRLSAAYFLITGMRYTPKCTAPGRPATLPLALRQQFVWEQQWEQKNSQAAQATADPCLRELYLELAQEGALHAGTIRSLLEQMA